MTVAGIKLKRNEFGWGHYYIKARFVPTKTGDLKPGFAALVGKTFIFQYAWCGDPDENYPDQMRYMWMPDPAIPELAWWCWAPEEDLEVLELMKKPEAPGPHLVSPWPQPL